MYTHDRCISHPDPFNNHYDSGKSRLDLSNLEAELREPYLIFEVRTHAFIHVHAHLCVYTRLSVCLSVRPSVCRSYVCAVWLTPSFTFSPSKMVQNLSVEQLQDLQHDIREHQVRKREGCFCMYTYVC
jgi:hypothetical protein